MKKYPTGANQRKGRIEVLKHLLNEQQVCLQMDLLARLKEQGFEITQSTLSRDMKTLQASKTTDVEGQTYYVLPERRYQKEEEEIRAVGLSHCKVFVSIAFSQNIAVIHTRPGYAAGLAAEIDLLQLDEIIGSISGDDTILLVMADGIQPNQLKVQLKRILPNIT